MDSCHTRLLRATLNISWRDKVTYRDLYGDLLKVPRKQRHQEEAAGTLELWDPRHGSPGSRHKTCVQVLLEDTGLENISEVISPTEDRSLWTSTAAYKHDDDSFIQFYLQYHNIKHNSSQILKVQNNIQTTKHIEGVFERPKMPEENTPN